VAETSEIEWTDATWNPSTGCTKVSKGCDNCYAERISERFRGVKGHAYEQGFDLKLWRSRLYLPLFWKKPRRIFVNSMSDLFHKDIPHDFIDEVFETMQLANWHTYQVLTKRSSLLRNYINKRFTDSPVPSHIWLGVSVEDKTVLSRVEHLRQTNASVRFLSVEPLLGPVGKLNLDDIHWVIVGGESGPNFRQMKVDWVRDIRDQCIEAGVAFFFKQWGGIRPKAGGNVLDGRRWQKYPRTARHKQNVGNSLAKGSRYESSRVLHK